VKCVLIVAVILTTRTNTAFASRKWVDEHRNTERVRKE